MKKNNIFLTLIVFIVFTGCNTLNIASYREGEPTADFGYPENKKVEKSFYLLGDGGYSPPGGSSEGLLAFKAYIDSVKQAGNYTLFLGDNIYPQGMVPEGHPMREREEYRLDAQIDAVENYDGKIIFMPGNHDWYNEGVVGLRRQEDYLQEELDRDDIFYPKAGCALESIEITEHIQLLIVDSQWYLEDWDDNPTINDNCQIKTREAFFDEVESELKENQNKTVVFAIHHPLYTNGLHGGNFHFNDHIFPTHRQIPLPILGSLVTLVRTTGGITSTDIQNLRYKKMRKRIETIAENWGNVIFVSGHDHSLQYIERDHIKQVVSGSASKASFASLRNDGLFSYTGQGFAVLDLFEDGSSWISFYGSENKVPTLLYQKEIFSSALPVETDTLSTSFPQTTTASIYDPEETEKGRLYRSIWGDRYRELYGTEIQAPVADLDTLFGGLEVLRKGGGHQTRSLRLQDSTGREYNMRALKKSAVQFLQTVAYKDTPIQEDLENTLADRIIQDFYTSSHPYGFMAIPRLSEAAGIYHTNPRLIYVPKQKALGDYNQEFGDELYMIVERPEEDWTGYESFGSPDHDIESTSGVFERLRRDEKYEVDEAAYIRARIFDMLVGDWDRHEDQWRWSEFEDEEGNRTFRPIPRDRDQVFSNYDGGFLATLRGITGFANQFALYDEDIEDVEWFNSAAMGLDRALIQNKGREEWMKQAEFLQRVITDEVIEDAFANLPEETRGESSENLVEKLRARRGNLIDIVSRYYDHLAEISIVTGTDKDDHIQVERLPRGETRITVYRIKNGEKADVVSDKIYSSRFTEEIWLYGLDDDDIFEVSGEGTDPIHLRIIGGQNNDIYRIQNGKKVRIYDHKSLPNTVEVNNGARTIFTDDYGVNVFDKDRRVFTSGTILPSVGFNPDDGLMLGLTTSYTINGFRRNPFTARHVFNAGYFFATQGFEIGYEGEFANVVGEYNLGVGAYYSSPRSTHNFFGWGNETYNPDDELSLDYNRTRLSEIRAEAGLVRKTPFGSYFRYMAIFEGIRVEETEGRFLVDEYTADSNFFKRQYFAGAEGTFRYESYDYTLNPTNGMKFELIGGGKVNTGDGTTFAYLDPYLEFYNAVSRDRKLVLNTRVQGEFNFGNDFQFYQAATLGGNNGLRGYRQERFLGKEAFAAGADLRYSFDQFRTRFLPFQIGIFAGYDLGRVWLEGEHSEKWHDNYGGGFWVTGASAMNGKFNLFKGSEGWRFSFGFTFDF